MSRQVALYHTIPGRYLLEISNKSSIFTRRILLSGLLNNVFSSNIEERRMNTQDSLNDYDVVNTDVLRAKPLQVPLLC